MRTSAKTFVVINFSWKARLSGGRRSSNDDSVRAVIHRRVLSISSASRSPLLRRNNFTCDKNIFSSGFFTWIFIFFYADSARECRMAHFRNPFSLYFSGFIPAFKLSWSDSRPQRTRPNDTWNFYEALNNPKISDKRSAGNASAASRKLHSSTNSRVRLRRSSNVEWELVVACCVRFSIYCP